jgi:hypothetical protein
MAKNVILEDEEIEILLSYHKERLAHVTAQLEILSTAKETSERRLHELAGPHEETANVTAEAAHSEAEDHSGNGAAVEEHAEVIAEAEPESLHLTDDGVVLAHEPATEIAAGHEEAEEDEETAETEHEPDVEAAEEEETVEETETEHISAEPEGVHHVEGEAEEAVEEHIDELAAGHDEEAPIAEAEHEEVKEEEETVQAPVAEAETESQKLAAEHIAETVAAQELHKGSFPA